MRNRRKMMNLIEPVKFFRFDAEQLVWLQISIVEPKLYFETSDDDSFCVVHRYGYFRFSMRTIVLEKVDGSFIFFMVVSEQNPFGQIFSLEFTNENHLLLAHRYFNSKMKISDNETSNGTSDRSAWNQISCDFHFTEPLDLTKFIVSN